ncbi:signal peptidase II [Psychrobacter sanguinis]|uniref:signal peptidase II n=1 Tax=Psychrobacter sanguinis TaxID=861445 RepID=UPI00191A119E|nr:signal peptidase II [Psychrobacter sanguinis]MCC3345177.1 signal peptidase II [Psychrobacter sanguinis]
MPNNSGHSSDTQTPAYATATPSLTKRPKLVPNKGRALLWYLLSLLVIGLDQWTKRLAELKLNFHEPIPVIEPILNWTLAYNYGAAFSFLADQGGWQKWFFAGLSLAMSIFLVIYLTRAPRQAKLLNVGLALILGGAIGNLIDRVRIGKVIDFIHVHYADVWHYPIFNIADIAICIGVAIVVIDMLFFESKRNAKFQA